MEEMIRMGYVKRTLLTAIFIVSTGVFPLFLCMKYDLAYGYDQADVDRLLKEKACPNCDLMDADLPGANLVGANLENANLTGANLVGANLTDANLTGVGLSGANLTGANLSHAIVLESNLNDVKVQGANFQRAYGLTMDQKEYLLEHGAIDVPVFIGDDGHLDSIYKDVTFKVYKTEELNVVKFSVKRFTKCHSLDIVEYDLGAALKIRIDDGPHKGENGWIDFWDFHED